MTNYQPVWEKDRRNGLSSKVESYPPPGRLITAEMCFDAYKICAAVRALQAARHLVAETGAIERMERDLVSRCRQLGIGTNELWDKYDRFEHAQRRANTKTLIGAGHFDGDVIQRSYQLKGQPVNPHYPFHDKPEPKRNVAAVTVHKGHVQNVMFNEDHGLSDGIHALVVAGS